MTSKSEMLTNQIRVLTDKDACASKKKLLNRARFMENNSPPPRHTIQMWDMNLSMKEKERLGINFNRSVTMSLESRWEVVNKLTVEFLKEVISLNDQLSEEASKQARQLLQLILTRTKRLGMASKMEQMAGLLMHITFYRTVLKAKVAEMQESHTFLMGCSELMGFTHPAQIMDRYTALTFTLNEIREEYEERANFLGKLQELHTEYIETKHEDNIVLYNKMAEMHLQLKDVRKEISDMERFVEERELQAAESMVTIQKIKSSIHHCYTSMMTYKGQECRETNPLKQMEEFGVRLENTISALKLIDDNNRRSRTESMTSDIVRKTVRMSGVSKESTHLNLALEEFKLTSWESVMDAYNTSGNWSPEYLTGAAKQSTPGLVSGSSGQRDDRCGQYGGFSLDARSRTFSAHSSLVSYNEAMRKVKGMAEQGTRKIQCQPFRSHGAADCSWDRWLRGLSPPTKSLSMGENEVTTQTKSGGLGVIAEQEFSQTEQATATPVARAGMPQISQNQMVCDSAATGRYIESINSSQSQRTLCVPLHTPKGRTSSGSLDRSSNKSATSYVLSPSRPAGSSKVAFFEKEPPKDRELLPALTKSSHNQTKRPLPSTRPDRWLPLAESGSLLRVSNRIKQQMADAARLYYLSSHAAAADQADPKCGIYWDHGCFLTAPRLQCKRGKLTTNKTGLPDKEKLALPDPKLDRKEANKDDDGKASPSRKTLSLPLKAAEKRLASFSDLVFMRQIDYLQESISNCTEDVQKSLRASKLSVERRSSSGLRYNRLSRESSTSSPKSPSGGKSPPRKPSMTRDSSSHKSLEKSSSALAKSYKPPLRRASLLRQQWRYAGKMAAQLSSEIRIQQAPSLPSRQNSGQHLPRKHYQTRHFKKDCLSILANVKLGSRWSDKDLDALTESVGKP